MKFIFSTGKRWFTYGFLPLHNFRGTRVFRVLSWCQGIFINFYHVDVCNCHVRHTCSILVFTNCEFQLLKYFRVIIVSQNYINTFYFYAQILCGQLNWQPSKNRWFINDSVLLVDFLERFVISLGSVPKHPRHIWVALFQRYNNSFLYTKPIHKGKLKVLF